MKAYFSLQNSYPDALDAPQGNFTINDAYTLLPFSNTMVNLVMTGEQIKNVLVSEIERSSSGLFVIEIPGLAHVFQFNLLLL